MSPEPTANPYRAPAAPSLPATASLGFWQSALGRCLVRWTLLGTANALLGGLFGFVYLAAFRHWWPNFLGVLLAFALLVSVAAYMDFSLRQSRREAWGDALRTAGLLKAVLQVLLLPDLFMGALAAGVVQSFVGAIPFLSFALITLAYGALVYTSIFVLAALVHAVRKPTPQT